MTSTEWEYIPDEQQRHIESDAIGRYIERERRAFVEYVINEAKEVVAVERFDRGAFIDGIRVLSLNGFDVSPEPDKPTPSCYLHPADFQELYNDVSETSNVVRSDDGQGLGVANVDCYPDGGIREGEGLLIHPGAIKPNIPHRGWFHPWLVADGNGVVVMEKYADK